MTPTGNETMTAASPGAYSRSGIAALACGVALAAAAIASCLPKLPASPLATPDARWYLKIAEGNIDQVHRPFANRYFEPLLARLISHGAGVGLQTSFFALGLVSLVVFCLSLAAIELRLTGWWFFALAPAIPFLGDLMMAYLLPDVMHAALVALFLWALERRAVFTTALLLFVMQITRESTLLLGGVAVLILALRGERRWAASACAAMALGVAATAWATRGALPNVHGMPEPVYLALKAPFNFAKHCLGVNLWCNSLSENLRPPVRTWSLPAWAPTGNLRTIGYVDFDPRMPLNTLASAATLFGVFPSIALLAAIRRGRSLAREYRPAASVTIVYGLASFLLAPLLGAGLGHLLGYGWPLLVAGPAILARDGLGRRAAAAVLSAHLLCAWLPLFPWRGYGYHGKQLIALALAACLHAAVLAACWRKIGRRPGAAPATT